MNHFHKHRISPSNDDFSKQMHYWDNVAVEKKFHTSFDVQLFLKYVKPSDVVLDFGCGYGRLLGELIKYKFQYLYGVDFSEQMLTLGKKSYPDVSFSQNIGIDISFENDFFDAVILSAVIGCVAGNSQQKYLIKEIIRILKPGGFLYLADFLINNDENNIKRYQEFKNTREFPYGVFRLRAGAVLRHHTEEYINQLLTELDIHDFKKTIFRTMDNNNSNGFVLIAQKL